MEPSREKRPLRMMRVPGRQTKQPETCTARRETVRENVNHVPSLRANHCRGGAKRLTTTATIRCRDSLTDDVGNVNDVLMPYIVRYVAYISGAERGGPNQPKRVCVLSVWTLA